MLAKERQNAIVEEVNINGSVLVKELARKYEVTEDSIRKDLTLLEKNGLLKKTYGGAMRIRNKISVNELTASKRIGKHTQEKIQIARKAYELLEDGDMIFLDLSTTNIELARLLAQGSKKVEAVTNMVEILSVFIENQYRNFIFIGGNLNQEWDAFTGSIANAQIENYRFDKSFLGLEGVDLQKGNVYNHSVDEAMTKKIVMEHSVRSYMLMEYRKLNMEGNYAYAQIRDFDGVLCESELTESQKEAFLKEDVECI